MGEDDMGRIIVKNGMRSVTPLANGIWTAKYAICVFSRISRMGQRSAPAMSEWPVP